MVVQQNFPVMERALTAAVRSHYDRLSIFYHWLWGEHIHHGFWRDGESPREAQVTLIEELAARTAVPVGARVLDVGCGLGGSAFWLAQNRGCSVLGITISPVQKRLAEKRAHSLGVSEHVEFVVKDANELDLQPESFDAVWNIECSEHLLDKRKFIAESARLLRRGGTLGLCAWLRPERSASSELVEQICASMLCPSLAALDEYTDWLDESGLTQITARLITARVEKTWDVCHEIVRRPAVRLGLRFMPRQTRRFAATFATMRQAYRVGALAYGMFTARKW